MIYHWSQIAVEAQFSLHCIFKGYPVFFFSSFVQLFIWYWSQIICIILVLLKPPPFFPLHLILQTKSVEQFLFIFFFSIQNITKIVINFDKILIFFLESDLNEKGN